MRKLVRFVSIALAGALVVTGATVGAVAVGVGLFKHTSSSHAAQLAPLGLTLAEPSVIYADDHKTVLAVLTAAQNRKPVKLSQISPNLIHAVLDTEDERFYQHGGIDFPSILRALVHDSAGGGLQGGSTITQQLVKQTYLNSSRTLTRKLKEAVLAERLQTIYTKNQILQAYLNTIYLGNGAYGVEAAANEYFNTNASKLTIAQGALLAGMIQDPNGYDPVLHPTLARARRKEVLGRMVFYHTITQAQANKADATPLPVKVYFPQAPPNLGYGYYASEVVNQLLAPGSPLGSTYTERYNALFEGGLKIYTNLDPREQSLAEAAVKNDINSVGASHGDTGALAAIEPATGKVRALVGGPGTKISKFDLATQAVRQPGSGFKLFTLLAAYEKGYSPKDTIDGTAPCPVPFPGDNGYVLHPPHNASPGEGNGPVTIDQATAQSINCAFIRLGQKVGLPAIINEAHTLGLTENFKPYPSIIIGGQGVTVLQMANAYATVADNGVYHAPSFIGTIVNPGGKTIYNGAQPGRQVIPVQVDRMALSDLEQVVLNGTGTAAALSGRQAAGKTGTTDQSVDAWFNGITPQLAASVWMGNPKGDSATYSMDGVGGLSQVYGGNFPAQAWHDFMQPALAPTQPETFPKPDPSLIPPGKFLPSPGTGGISANNGSGTGSSGGGTTHNGATTYSGPGTTSPPTTSAPTTSAPPAPTPPPTTGGPPKPGGPPTTGHGRG